MLEWKPIKDMPEGIGDVLLFHCGGWIGIGRSYSHPVGDEIYWDLGDRNYPRDDFTHWMPLPNPPKDFDPNF